MIDPLYGGKTAHDVFQTLLNEPMLSAYDAVRETWKPTIKGDFETGWRKALHDGWIADTAYDKTAKRAQARSSREQFPRPTPKDSLEIIFRPDPNIYDGRWINVGWLQELPKPVTSLSWDNAAIVSGATLTKLGLEEDDIVELTRGQRQGEGAGDRGAGPSRQLGDGVPGLRPRVRGPRGLGAGLQRLPDSQHVGAVLRDGLDPQGRWQVGHRDHQEPLPGSPREAFWQGQGTGNNSLEADEALGPRGIIRYATLDEFKANPNFAHEGERHDTPSMRHVAVPQLAVQRSQRLGACRST